MRTMKKLLIRAAIIVAFIAANHVMEGGPFDVLLKVGPVAAQTNLTQTTITSAITSGSQQVIVVASATGISAPSPVTGNTTAIQTQTALYIDQEEMFVTGVNGKFITVTRGYNSTQGVTHASGAVVWVGTPQQFYTVLPQGSCTAANTVNPYIDTMNGQFWLCDSGTGNWLPVLSTGSITPAASSAAIQTAAQTFTLTGVSTGEPLVIVSMPAPTSLCPLVGVRVTAANTVSLYFSTLTAAACTPAAGTYMFFSPRLNAAF